MKHIFASNGNVHAAKTIRRRQPSEIIWWKVASVGCLFLLFGQGNIVAQTCSSLACTVQYQVSGTNLNKCLFPNCTNADWPRIHMYHHQKTHAIYYFHVNRSGTNSYSEYSEYDDGSSQYDTFSDGAYNYDDITDKDVTLDEFALGNNCNYTNIYSGYLNSFSDITDARSRNMSNNGSDCDHGWTGQTNHYSDIRNNPAWAYVSGDWQWAFTETELINNANYIDRTCHGSCTNCGGYSSASTNLVIEGANLFFPLLVSISLTEIDYTLPYPPRNDTNGSPAEGFTIRSEHGTKTVTVDDEYTDEELYTNICNLIPAYSGDWYSGNDFWQSCAYSGIAASHVDGNGLTGSHKAELQKMKYRFDVPNSQPVTQYKITWDLVTYDTAYGVMSTMHNETNLVGNGSDVYSDEYDVPAPWWDGSDLGGFQFTFVANVHVSIVSQNIFSVVGAGPGWNLSAGDTGCSSCSGAVSGNVTASGGAFATFSLGRATSDYSAGQLRIQSPQLTPASSTLDALSIIAPGPGVEIIQTNNQLRQIYAPQALVDIVVSNAYSYQIKFYYPSQVGSLTNGVHQLTGSPFLIWQVANPDGSSATNRLQFTLISGTQVSVYECNFAASSGSWKYEYPGGIREEEVNTTNAITELGSTTIVTITTRVPGGPDQYKVKRVYQTYCPELWSAPSGPYLVQETLDPDNNPKTTTYTYDWDGFANGTTIPLSAITRPDGSWESYSYDTLGRLTTVKSAKQNAKPGDIDWGYNSTSYYYNPVDAFGSGSGDDGTINPNTPRKVYQTVNGAVNLKYTMFPSSNIRIESRGMWWGDPNNLVTTTTYYNTGPNTNRMQSVLNPDGTMQFYTYSRASDGSQTNTVCSGQPNTGKTNIVDGTKIITIIGPVGQLVSRTQIDIFFDITTSRETYGNYDSFSRPQTVTYLDGTSNITAYACCGVDFTIDRDGVATYYQYDAAKRQVATTRLNVTTTNVLDSVGNVLKTLRIGSDNSVVTMNCSKYDLAGQLVVETNALGGVTGYSEATNSFGGLIRTNTYPDGGTRIEEYYLDRSLMKVTGTAVQPVRYEYGADGNNQYTREIKLLDGADSSEWIQTETDALGRPCKTIYAAPDGQLNPTSHSYYNILGQLTNSVDPDGVSTLFAYDAKGEQIITAADVDQNGAIDFDGRDRISWTTNDVVSGHNTFVRRSQTFAWDTFDSVTPKLVSINESSVNGLDSWQTVYRDVSTPVESHSQTVYGSGGARTQTTTAPDGSSTINVYSYGRLVSTTRYDSGSLQIGRTAYTYDAHGRQSTATDARNDATIYEYNNADLATRITTPSPGSGGSPETTTTYYDTSLRTTKIEQPDGTSVTNIYYPGGQLEETYGSRTYPVAYTYDYAGRMKTMTTWQNFPSSGAYVTTWNYDPFQGFLTNKAYADGLGPVYTYTPAGRIASRTWVRLVADNPLATSYAYDTAGSLTNISYSDGTTPAVGTTYDRLGRPSTIAQDNLTTTQKYNLAGELLSEAYTGSILDGLSVSNTYDAVLRRAALTARSGGTSLLTTSYGYDHASRLQIVNDGNGNTVSNSYLENSPLVNQIAFKESGTTRMTTTKQFDYLNRLTQMSSQPAGSGLPPVTFNYNYNSANQRTRDALTDGSYWVYQYDSLGQVTSGHKLFADGTPVPGQQFDYSFDTIGNRTQTKSGGDQTGGNQRVAAYTANNLNQYTSRDYPGTNDIIGAALATNGVTVNGTAAWRKGEYFWATVKTNNTSSPAWLGTTVASGGITNTGHVYMPQTPELFSYDADGNLTNDGHWAYTWDGENRLIGMTVNTNVGPQYQMTFGYDFQGRRIQKIVATNGVTYATNNFLYDGWNLVAEVRPDNTRIRTYIWGSDLSGSAQGAGGVGGLLEVSYYGSSTTNAFVAYDGNGNVSALVNVADGTLLANYEYSPFGETIRSTGLLAKNNPFRFSTKYQDDESDQLYYGYRFYNQNTGRWLSRDPIGESGGDNVYEFSINNPVLFFDWLGRATYTSDDLLSIEPKTQKRIPCGTLTLKRVFVDASNKKSLMTEDTVAFDDLITSLQTPPSTFTVARIRHPSYLGSGFILEFDKSPSCPCEKFEWLQMVSRPNGKAFKQDYKWTSSSGANFRAADFPGSTFSGYIARDWTWRFQLTLYCYGCGTKIPLTTVMWSSHIMLNGLGSVPYATVNLDIDGF